MSYTKSTRLWESLDSGVNVFLKIAAGQSNPLAIKESDNGVYEFNSSWISHNVNAVDVDVYGDTISAVADLSGKILER